uniref:Copine domain-containing protein n=1 Tax=Syphacia muris TaxID=451379 RepID=A0A0N5ATK1_9BILA
MSLTKYDPLPPAIRNNLVVYLLDDQPLSKLQKLLKLCPIMHFRKFPFYMFPLHVRKLTTYSFKILIVALMLKEYKFVLWTDTSTCFNPEAPGFTIPEFVKEMARKRMSFAFNHRTGHSIYAATHPVMYKYIPMEKDIASNTTMTEASIMHFMATKSLKRTILLRAVQCALIRNCIAPLGSKVPCSAVPESRRDVYFNCHRFDQSAMTLIASAYSNRSESGYLLLSAQWSTPRRAVFVVIIGTEYETDARIGKFVARQIQFALIVYLPIGPCPDSKNGQLATISDIGVTFCYFVKSLGKGGTVFEAGQEACREVGASMASLRDAAEMQYVQTWIISKQHFNNLLIKYTIESMENSTSQYEPPCYMLRRGFRQPQECGFLPIHFVLCKKAYQASRCNVVLKRKKIVRRFTMKKKKMFKKYKKTMKKLVISADPNSNSSMYMNSDENVDRAMNSVQNLANFTGNLEQQTVL